MRIGNLDDPNNAEGLIELIQADAPANMTKSQKRKNWWHYYKWYVIVGGILLVALIQLIGHALGLFTKSPDLQIAYVSAGTLPEDTVAALEQAFGTLIEDFNGDGAVIVQVNQYVRDSSNTDAETAYYQYASELTLIGDISDCESYLFLLDDPQRFQREFQILAEPDGGCPDVADYSADDKIIRWGDCPLLTALDLGSFSTVVAGQEVNGDNRALVEDLYLGRRCFPTDKMTENLAGCEALWDVLSESAGNK